ncbi:9 TM domain-containing transmembrane protein [Acrasis kona]|uniref:9 TM domain-containing transmembrane protein n=1 Tax=Acrasis kona TaxID=1008807 RepID=A0AAW2ZCY1_9EUKA
MGLDNVYYQASQVVNQIVDYVAKNTSVNSIVNIETKYVSLIVSRNRAVDLTNKVITNSNVSLLLSSSFRTNQFNYDQVITAVQFSYFNPYGPNPNISTGILTLDFLTSNRTIISVNDLVDPIQFEIAGTFTPNVTVSNSTTHVVSPVCRYYNKTTLSWLTNGCKILNTSQIPSKCICNHTTDFAIFLEVIPRLNLLSFDDLGLIVRLNKDNYTTVVVLSVFSGIYLLALLVATTIDCLVKVKDHEVLYEIGSFRRTIYKYIKECQYLSYLSKEKIGALGRCEKITIVYVYILGAFLGNALSFGQSNSDNIIQTFAAGFICSLVVAPFVTVFLFLFTKTNGYNKKKVLPDDILSSTSVDQVPATPKMVYVDVTTPGTPIERVEENIQIDQDLLDEQSQSSQNQMLPKKHATLKLVLDWLDYKCDRLTNAVYKCIKKLTWQGVLLFVVASICYFAFVTVFVIVAPYCFEILTPNTMSAITGVLVDAYFFAIFFAFAYIRVKKFRERELLVWRAKPKVIIVGVFTLLALLAAIVAVATVNGVVLEYGTLWYFRVVVINSCLGALAILNIIWIIFMSINRKVEVGEDLTNRFVKKIAAFFKKPTWFPWWTIIFIYLLCAGYIAVSSYFLIIYGIKFDNQSNYWLGACGISLVQDIFINSPIGFLVKSILFVLIMLFFETLFFGTSAGEQIIKPPTVEVDEQITNKVFITNNLSK